MRIMKTLLTLIILAALCVCLTGCDQDDEDGNHVPMTAWMPI